MWAFPVFLPPFLSWIYCRLQLPRKVGLAASEEGRIVAWDEGRLTDRRGRSEVEREEGRMEGEN